MISPNSNIETPFSATYKPVIACTKFPLLWWILNTERLTDLARLARVYQPVFDDSAFLVWLVK